VITLALLCGPMPWANAAPAAPEVMPQAPVAATRAAVTPTIASIPASATVSAQSTTTQTVGAQTVLASVPARDTATFNLVGASWTTSSGITLQIQTKSATGWTDWTDLSTELSKDATDSTINSVADPLYVGDSTGIALRALGGPGASISGLTAKTVTSPAVADDSRMATVSALTVSGIGAPQPSIVSRAGWGADESLRTSCSNGTYDSTIKAAVIHHTAGTNDYTAAQSALIVRGVYAYHVRANGWCDIGYNFLIDKFGTIFEGRWGGIDKAVHGAHAGSWNTNTMGVSFMMNSDSLTLPDVSLQSAVSLLAWKLGGFYRDPLGTTTLVGAPEPVIFGHGVVMATDCPGTDIRARMQDIRNQTYNAMYWVSKTPLYNLWINAGADSSTFGSVKQLERNVGSGREVTFQNGGAYETPSGQVFSLGAGLDALYQAQGGPTGSLGWPTSNQVAVADGFRATFVNGSLTFPQSSPATAFVKASYQDFLGRAPGQPEIDAQVLSLVTGKLSRASYLSSLANSDEWLSSIVTKFYQDSLGRSPDPVGLAGWISALRSGQRTPAEVASMFYASDEYYAKVGGTNGLVNSLYTKLLNRSADPLGFAYWVGAVGSQGRTWVAFQFYQSTESRQVRVSNLYQALLQRGTDPIGLAGWTDRILTTGDITLAVNIAGSDEYWSKAQTRFPS
jgi:N-acetylmuramoyl-L-alanine amidase/Domain of unknown function (DUF4214)